MKYIFLSFLLLSLNTYAGDKSVLIDSIINSDDTIVNLQNQLAEQSAISKQNFIQIISYARNKKYYESEQLLELNAIFERVRKTDVFNYDLNIVIKSISNELSKSYTLKELIELKALLENPLYKKHLGVSETVLAKIKNLANIKSEETKKYIYETMKEIDKIDYAVMKKMQETIEESKKNSNK